MADRVSTFSQAWLGLTVGCARCHDHKFDPITQRDYYRFFAFFNNVPEMGEDARVANAVPMISAPTAEQQHRLHELEAAISTMTKRVEDRERTARLRQRNVQEALASARNDIPSGAVLQIHCESDNEFAKRPENGFTLAEGVVGKSCATKSVVPKPQTATKNVPVSKRQPLTFSAWVRPDAADDDVALLSTMNYATNPASVTYGAGMELRLTGGEVEFRYADRFPAYSIRVRSDGAHLSPGQWRHVTAIYRGV